MALETLENVLARLRALGATRVLAKQLAENDNTKQQIYLGGSFDTLNILPFGELYPAPGLRRPTLKAPVPLSWMDATGHVAPAPFTKLILYPKYPEVRLSGFLRGCPTAPNRDMQPVPRGDRRHPNLPDGRVMLLAIAGDRTITAFLISAGSRMAAEFGALISTRRPVTRGVFLELPLEVTDSRAQLLARLREIHAAGWHDSTRLKADGTRIAYVARNGAGYTLEALLGVVPNGRSEPDYLGWEVKACGSDRVTLLTPEPDAGYYGQHGVEAFLRRYGRPTSSDTLYFTGIHRVGETCEGTGQRLLIEGFDALRGRITDSNGGLRLVSADGSVTAAWSFPRLLQHWGRKHASAAYVPYSTRNDRHEYRFDSPALLGEGTDFTRFLVAMAAGDVVYDPAPKLMGASTAKSRTKARSQFRIKTRALGQLYATFVAEPL
ncbi:MAG: hypothetical protein JNM50_03585 [Chromatiales bacterium]|nr:hypothetical protein [Chromatiales bacterium]